MTPARPPLRPPPHGLRSLGDPVEVGHEQQHGVVDVALDAIPHGNPVDGLMEVDVDGVLYGDLLYLPEEGQALRRVGLLPLRHHQPVHLRVDVEGAVPRQPAVLGVEPEPGEHVRIGIVGGPEARGHVKVRLVQLGPHGGTSEALDLDLDAHLRQVGLDDGGDVSPFPDTRVDEQAELEPPGVAGLRQQLPGAGQVARVLEDRLVVPHHALGNGTAHLHRPPFLHPADDPRVVDGVGDGLADLHLGEVGVLVVQVEVGHQE